ncbi:MAG: hypothetical protein EXX96DRAFT_569234 [Benjaminiella poitrasii]|nr:MAG: hypothetical protein EXX96DRAFT_569234 [Benjaminiella poitrasii]
MMYKPISCNCTFQNLFTLDHQKNRADNIEIVKAEKTSTDNTTNTNHSFVVYTIKIIDNEEKVKRRYSEFESFRKSLVKLYPTTVIPPIPEKHSFSDYAIYQKQKDDSFMIEKRKRMLERFLKKIASHPVLNQEHVFHRFLDSESTWTDIANSPPLSILPKDPLLQSSLALTSYMITSNLPIPSTSSNNTNAQHNSIIPTPSSSYTLKYPDKEFEQPESKVNKSAQQCTFQFDKSQKRILKRLQELSNDYAELGSAYNAWSLNEAGPIASLLEKIGQTVDGSATSTKEMVQTFETDVSEYVQEYTQYLTILKRCLEYRRMKQAQSEMIEDSIRAKRTQLRSLVKTEEESRRLSSNSETRHEEITTTVQQDEDDHCIDTESIEDGFSAIVKTTVDDDAVRDENLNYPTNASAPMIRASKHQSKKWSSPRKLFSAVTYTLQGMIDADPEQTRRNQISKLRDAIEQLEQAQISTRQELKDMSVNMQKDFERLQRQKEADMKSILLAFAKIHIRYCEQNASDWLEMRDKVIRSMKD